LKPEEVTNLDPRTAITFTPGVPPIATRLVRYYDKSFTKPRRMGMVKMAVDTACLFLLAAASAAWLTAAVFYFNAR
jgi:type IV secretion system protein VirD4